MDYTGNNSAPLRALCGSHDAQGCQPQGGLLVHSPLVIGDKRIENSGRMIGI